MGKGQEGQWGVGSMKVVSLSKESVGMRTDRPTKGASPGAVERQGSWEMHPYPHCHLPTTSKMCNKGSLQPKHEVGSSSCPRQTCSYRKP
jgi:hypothetical protein